MMRISVNGSLNFIATAAKLRIEATTTASHIFQAASDQAASVKRDCQEWAAAVNSLTTQGQKLGRAVGKLNGALIDLTPTLTQLDRQLAHWQRTNEVPIDKINDLLSQFNQQEKN